jgi:class 3 adenylate cyclase
MVQYNAAIRGAEAARDALFEKILPSPLVRKFKRDGKISENFAVVQFVSISFVKFVNFTEWSQKVAPIITFNALNDLFARFDAILSERRSIMKVKTLGDVYMTPVGYSVM